MARPFAAFDIDGTLIRWQLLHAIAEELAKIELIAPKDYRQVKDARTNWRRRLNPESYSRYEQKLIGAFDNTLEGLSVSQFTAAADIVFSEYKEQVYIYTRDLIARLKKDGYLLFALSGSPDIIVKKLASFYGFDDYAATRFIQKDGYFTGQKDTAFDKKPELLNGLIEKHGASREGSVAVGDTELDIDLLESVNRPIAFNPSNLLYDYATKRGWPIVIERKNVVYKLEQTDGRYQLV